MFESRIIATSDTTISTDKPIKSVINEIQSLINNSNMH